MTHLGRTKSRREPGQRLSPVPEGDRLSLPDTQGANIQIPKWSLGRKGCTEMFLHGSPWHFRAHRQAWDGQNGDSRGRCSAPLTDSPLRRRVWRVLAKSVTHSWGDDGSKATSLKEKNINRNWWCWAERRWEESQRSRVPMT